MKEQPKYTLVMFNSWSLPFHIIEHAQITNSKGHRVGISSKTYNQYSTLDQALKALAELSYGPILIAASSQPVEQ